MSDNDAGFLFLFCILMITILSVYSFYKEIKTESKKIKKTVTYFVISLLMIVLGLVISGVIIRLVHIQLSWIEILFSFEDFMVYYFWIISVPLITLLLNTVTKAIFIKKINATKSKDSINNIGIDIKL